MVIPPREPDFFEKCVRFGCGLTFGLLAGFYLVARDGGHSSWGFWLVPVGVALGCAALAVKYGDDFWRNIFKW
jgi:hypothetical protein